MTHLLFFTSHIEAATASVREQNLHLVSFNMWYADTAFRIFYVLSCKLAFITVHFSRRHWHIMQLFFNITFVLMIAFGVRFFCLTNIIEYHKSLFKVTKACNTCGGTWWAPEPCPPRPPGPPPPCMQISASCVGNFSSRSTEVMRLSPPPPICCEGLDCLCTEYFCSCHNATTAP